MPTTMKAAVLGENGVEVRDIAKPEPKPNEVLIRVRASSLNRADLLVALGHQHGSVGGVGARIGLECSGRGRGGRRRGQGHQGRRPRHGLGARRLRRICRHRCRAGAPHSRQQHDLRAGGVFSGRAADHAQRGGHRRAIQARRNDADAGRQRRRRPDGHADRQADGRVAGAWAPRPMRRAARGSRNTAATSQSTPAIRTGRKRSERRPATKAST